MLSRARIVTLTAVLAAAGYGLGQEPPPAAEPEQDVVAPAAEEELPDDPVEDEEPPVEPVSAEPTLDPAALEAFLDGYMASFLEEKNIAGAAVSVIEGNALVLAKGYGLADVEARTPVDPETTLFRIGSVSKLFVWTAVMQLVAEGRIDLDTDVNEYLRDLEVPAAFGEPVTMSDLMTHTAGFDERVLGLFAESEEALRPLGEILAEELPSRVRPPGQLVSYSNHGTALAMYVVEQVTGTPWNEYLREKIIEPLGMSSTTFEQPIPERLASQMSKGYRLSGGELSEAPFEFIPLAAVGAAASSATDMARFLSAHLGLGRHGETRILDEATAERMQSTLFRPHPEVNGMAYGLIELDWNGERIVGHGGDTELFHTLFAFFPERDIGVFAAFNTVGADYVKFLQAFVDWRFPAREPAPTRDVGALGRFTGVYRPTRYPNETIARLSALLSSFEVRAEEGKLVTRTPELRRWEPIGPLLFQEVGTSARAAFRETVDGQVTHLFLSEIPVISFERAPPTERPKLVAAIAGVSLALMVLAVLFWPSAAWMRWHYRARLAREERISALGRWSAWLGALALAGFVVGLAVTVSDPMAVVYGVPPELQSLFWLPIVGLLFALAALLGVFLAWKRGRGTFLARVAFTLLVAAMGLFLWQLVVWRLFGFNF